MDANIRSALERHLRERRRRLCQQAAAAAKFELSLSTDILDSAAGQEFLDRITAFMDVRAQHELREIHAALMRMDTGLYGVCVACGAAIAIARLRVVPATRFCLRCARRQPPARAGDEAIHRGAGAGASRRAHAIA